ncbi:MAG: ATP-binding protein [Clostridiales bacterium]|jgi:predicted AAA+ superfamily ATPase|nr:ATP-binding protein [Clostridiales bacterium]
MYIQRHLERILKNPDYIRGVMAVTGCRQTGKSTLIEEIAKEKTMKAITLDDINMREAAKLNPKDFLAMYNPPLFIDEVQYAPELFPYMKIHVDKTKEMGAYYISGSQRFIMIKNLSESLAGRVGVFELLGLSAREIKGDSFNEVFVPTAEYLSNRNSVAMNHTELWQNIHKGGYPELYANSNIKWDKFYNDYINTYIERDVHQLENVGDEVKFYQFMQVVAANSGNLFNIDKISKDIGISRNVCEKWLSVLRASNLIYLLPPYYSNITKRAVKTPKLYFLDTGLMAFLTKWHTPQQIEAGAMAGAFFETFVFCEILKSFYNAGVDPKSYIYFYRDKDNNEIDFVINYGSKLHPVEVKKKSNPGAADIKAFRFLENNETYERGNGAVICTNDGVFPITEKDNAVPFYYI